MGAHLSFGYNWGMEYVLLCAIALPLCALALLVLLLITGLIRDPSGAGIVAAKYRASWLQRR